MKLRALTQNSTGDTTWNLLHFWGRQRQILRHRLALWTHRYAEKYGRLDYEISVVEYWNHKLMKVEKELVDLNGEANGALYRGSKQKTRLTRREKGNRAILSHTSILEREKAK
ncbi:hypothetical protein DVH24_001406 [Malus domestica]|uniref:Uncharacterized protein n=1 Tax=Malus domestica TaxID=3750 RepID=A0A498K756_MALDO|nr:hypothetical protein DVH24_001406 [Malus domestica]